MVPEAPSGAGVKLLAIRAALLGLRGVQLVSPVPTARMIRALFARTGAAQAERLAKHAPTNVDARLDESYGSGADERFDVYTPAGPPTPRPTVVWVHGGGFVGGTKDELADYFRLLASHGCTVVAVSYTRAPEARFPTPVRQTLAVLRQLVSRADDLQVDTQRVFLAGDSAGSHIAAQAAMVCTDDATARRLDLEAVPGVRLAGVILCCGVYDVRSLDPTSSIGRLFVDAAMWSYSGARRYRDDEAFLSAMSVPDHLTASFPAAFVTVGNVDPLLAQSQHLVDRLEEVGAASDTLFFPPEHTPPLSHEYQFDLELEDARRALDAIAAFIRRTMVTSPQPGT